MSDKFEELVILSSESEEENQSKLSQDNEEKVSLQELVWSTDPEIEPEETKNHEGTNGAYSLVITEVHSLQKPGTSHNSPGTSQNRVSDVPNSYRIQIYHEFQLKMLSYLNEGTQKEEVRMALDKVGYHLLKCPKWYHESEQLIACTQKAAKNIERNPANIFVFLKDVLDEIKAHRNRPLPSNGTASTDKVVSESSANEDEGKPCPRILKLERLMRKLEKTIKQAGESEMTLDDLDSESSHYIYEHRLKKRYLLCYKLWCKLKERDEATGRRVHLKLNYNGTRYPEINAKVRKFINSSNALVFPDFSEILNIVKKTNEKHSLNVPESSYHSLAQEIFLDVGKNLKKRRNEDFVEYLDSCVKDEEKLEDPADSDILLAQKLDENGKIYNKKMEMILKEYTTKQEELKLEPKEVNDEEARRSPTLEEMEQTEGVAEEDLIDEESDGSVDSNLSHFESVLEEESNQGNLSPASLEVSSSDQRKRKLDFTSETLLPETKKPCHKDLPDIIILD